MRHLEVGLSLRDIILKWRHKTLILFKLLMLQKRVVCFGSPVRSMCGLILVISSLYPKLLEKGFKEVACVQTSRPMSPMPDFSTAIDDNVEIKNDDSDNDNKKKLERISSEDKYEREETEINELIKQKNESDNTINSITTEIENVLTMESKNQSVSNLNNDRNPLSRDASIDTLACKLNWTLFSFCFFKTFQIENT